ncbi:hypothetical protein SO694_00170020 [Aureococcus anophagefferens]|uniref:Uncharacterized protein n=1 Tax=Aureococcus anophagefferens TaxID=44056 RepID=A0ABR1FZ95_AURAN
MRFNVMAIREQAASAMRRPAPRAAAPPPPRAAAARAGGRAFSVAGVNEYSGFDLLYDAYDKYSTDYLKETHTKATAATASFFEEEERMQNFTLRACDISAKYKCLVPMHPLGFIGLNAKTKVKALDLYKAAVTRQAGEAVELGDALNLVAEERGDFKKFVEARLGVNLDATAWEAVKPNWRLDFLYGPNVACPASIILWEATFSILFENNSQDAALKRYIGAARAQFVVLEQRIPQQRDTCKAKSGLVPPPGWDAGL